MRAVAAWLRRIADRIDPEPVYETPEWMEKPLIPLDEGTVLHIPRFESLTRKLECVCPPGSEKPAGFCAFHARMTSR